MNVVIIGFSPDMVRDSKFCKTLSKYSISRFEGCSFFTKKALLILYNIIKYYISEWGKI